MTTKKVSKIPDENMYENMEAYQIKATVFLNLIDKVTNTNTKDTLISLYFMNNIFKNDDSEITKFIFTKIFADNFTYLPNEKLEEQLITHEMVKSNENVITNEMLNNFREGSLEHIANKKL